MVRRTASWQYTCSRKLLPPQTRSGACGPIGAVSWRSGPSWPRLPGLSPVVFGQGRHKTKRSEMSPPRRLTVRGYGGAPKFACETFSRGRPTGTERGNMWALQWKRLFWVPVPQSCSRQGHNGPSTGILTPHWVISAALERRTGSALAAASQRRGLRPRALPPPSESSGF